MCSWPLDVTLLKPCPWSPILCHPRPSILLQLCSRASLQHSCSHASAHHRLCWPDPWPVGWPQTHLVAVALPRYRRAVSHSYCPQQTWPWYVDWLSRLTLDLPKHHGWVHWAANPDEVAPGLWDWYGPIAAGYPIVLSSHYFPLSPDGAETHCTLVLHWGTVLSNLDYLYLFIYLNWMKRVPNLQATD